MQQAAGNDPTTEMFNDPSEDAFLVRARAGIVPDGEGPCEWLEERLFR